MEHLNQKLVSVNALHLVFIYFGPVQKFLNWNKTIWTGVKKAKLSKKKSIPDQDVLDLFIYKA